MYVNMMRRVPRPRGLGGVAQVAAGLGAWVVDKPWGLSPSIIPGQPRPYQGMVRTMLPRSQHPRLLNASYRVLAAGSWPRLLPANSPVFRTPVIAPGAQAVNEALPGDSVPRGVAGYGWVPMGVAHPPYFLAETSGMSGFSGSGTGADLSAEDQKWLADNPRKVTKAIRDSAVAYASLRARANVYQNLYQTFALQAKTNQLNAKGTGSNAEQRATLAVYGSAQAKLDAASDIQRWASAAAEIELIATREGLTVSGPLSVLASQPGANNLSKGAAPDDFSGYGAIATGTAIIIAVIAAVAAAGATYHITRQFDEAATIAAKTQAEWMTSTRAARVAQSEVLADLTRQLGAATDPADAQRIQDAINTITGSMTAINGVNTELTKTAGATNWSQVLLLGGTAVFAWFMLGKPFWKGARRSIETQRATSYMPTPIGG